jgi:hypothetical protein
MAAGSKNTADQVGEIEKLVEDAQDKLDQVVRALRSLEERLGRAEPRAEPQPPPR